MARLQRLYLPGCAQHIIQRGNNREACFYGEADYKAYLSFLKDAAQKYRVDLHAFVLMTNHVHLLATPKDQYGISRMMQAGSMINGVMINGVRLNLPQFNGDFY